MIKSSTLQNRLYWTAIIYLAILAVLSLVYYKERMLFVDPAFIVFEIINKNKFVFSEHRVGAFITQWVPLIGSRLGLPLQSILIGYSLSFHLFYLMTAIVVGFLWKQKWIAVILALYYAVFVSDVFYWPNNEVHQGIAWMCLFLGSYFYNEDNHFKWWRYILSLLFLILAVMSHLLLAIPLVFVWVYLILSYPTSRLHKHTFLTSFIIIAVVIFRYYISKDSWYDGNKLEQINSFRFSKIWTAFQSIQIHSFLKLCIQNYWIAILIIFSSAYWLLKKKQFTIGLVWIIFIMGYFALIGMTFPDVTGRNMQFYIESEWMGLAIIIALPTVYAIFKSNSTFQPYYIYFLLLIFAIRLVYIWDAGHYFSERLQSLERVTTRLIHEKQTKTIFIENNDAVDKTFIMNWGLPIESLLLSTMQQADNPITFKTMPTLNDSNFHQNKIFYSSFKNYNYDALNSYYFKMDTLHSYQIKNNLNDYIQQ